MSRPASSPSSPPSSDGPSSTARRTRVRWWILVAIWGLVGIAIGTLWAVDAPRQTIVIATIASVFGGVMLSLLWLLVVSGLSIRARLIATAVLLVVLGLVFAAVEIRGVSGDLVPIVEWRWRAEPGAELAVPAGESRSAGSPDSDAHVESPLAEIAPGDFPQFLGPTRDGVIRGISLERDWTTHPPRERWRRPVGAGWASFAVAGPFAYTVEQRGELEAITCYALADGSEVWVYAYPARYDTVVGGLGPRSTPTITRDRVYATGGTGILTCVDRATGWLLWQHDVPKENGGTVAEWGYSISPLVVGDLVIVGAGGPDGRSLVAYERESGKTAWSAGDDRSGYSSPSLVDLAGHKQIIIFNHSSLTAHDPRDGALLWSWPWQSSNPNVAQPHVIGGDRVFFSTGYSVGCQLLQILDIEAKDGDGLTTSFTPKPLWRNRNLKAKFSNFIVDQEFVWGLDDGILTCLDLETGARRWKSGRFGHGQMLLAGDVLLVTSETGGIHLIERSPDEFRELASIEAIDGKVWQGPSLTADGLLLHRSDRVAVCYELPTRGD